ncbi:MAG: sigma factor [Chitinophagales bacterium]|nr:sigma factor [Chitinophagales bacterium]
MRIIKKLFTRKKIIGRKEKSPALDLELCARFQSGDLSAFPELSDSYSKLLDTVVAKYINEVLPTNELMLHAKIGLLKAAHRFDESKMVSFRLYAIWWMRQVIMKALHEQESITHIPEMLIFQFHDILHAFTRRENVLSEGIENPKQSEKKKTSEIVKLRNLNKPDVN